MALLACSTSGELPVHPLGVHLDPVVPGRATAAVFAAHADAVAVGRAVIANPDLVERWRGQHPENEPNPATFYGTGPEGYTDYPTLALSQS